jgi:lysophospholipase L1-like esterase
MDDPGLPITSAGARSRRARTVWDGLDVARAPGRGKIVVLVGAAAAPEEDDALAGPGPSRADAGLRFVALGDSYTIGTAVPPAERWPDQLARRLATGGAAGAARLELTANLGVDGFTAADVIRTQLPALPGLRPDFASLLVGVNDVVRGVPLERYEANLDAILAALLERLRASRLVTISTPDYTVTPAGADYGDPATVRAGIERVNAVMAAHAARRGIAHVDVLAISRRAAAAPDFVAADGLHPSGRQYAAWVDAIEPVVRDLLARPSG